MDNWRQKKIMVTGGGGFLGRCLVERLKSLGANSIRILCRSEQPELEKQGISVCRTDIKNEKNVIDACEDCDIVFHTAAKAGVWGKWQEYFDTNVTGTENIIKACRTHKIPFLVNTSSPSVAYPPTHDIENIDESQPFPDEYSAHYPHTKAMAESMVSTASSPDLSTVSLRPHLIYGPRDPHLLPRVVAKAKAKKLMIVGDGKNKVDLTYVENAAEAHIKAAETLFDNPEKITGKTYFISDDNPVVLWEWINSLLAQCGISEITRKISYRNAYIIGFLMEMVYKSLNLSGEPPMTRFVAGQLAFSHYFNISRAKTELNYKPVIPPDVALKKNIQWLISDSKQ